jgi:hypothetical protein
MVDKTFIVRFKARELSNQLVIAANAEIYADHMVLLNSTGTLAALFLLEVVESWTELPRSHHTPNTSHCSPVYNKKILA